MRIWQLWQYHSLTAVGEKDIIEAANKDLAFDYQMALDLVSEPCKVLTTIEQAQDHFLSTERGSVSYKELK